jgi:hypothetical protein
VLVEEIGAADALHLLAEPQAQRTAHVRQLGHELLVQLHGLLVQAHLVSQTNKEGRKEGQEEKSQITSMASHDVQGGGLGVEEWQQYF